MKKTKLLTGLMFAGFTAMAGSASAAITGPTVIDFETLAASSVAGKPNLAGASTAGMYSEEGVRIGIVNDPLDTISHLHQVTGTSTGTQLQYHSDSSGIYMRASDNTAFSLWGMDFHSPYDASHNPHAQASYGGNGGANDYWDIYGYSDARNPGLLTDAVDANGLPTDPNDGFPANPAIAHVTVTNGFDDYLNLLSLDPAFASIKAVWIHYHGYPHSPNAYIEYDVDGNALNSAYSFAVEIDNVKLDADGVVPATVPVPAAVWMFGTGLVGLLSMGRKKRLMA